MIELYAQGKIKLRVSADFPLGRGGEAIALLAGRGGVRQVVVTVQ